MYRHSLEGCSCNSCTNASKSQYLLTVFAWGCHMCSVKAKGESGIEVHGQLNAGRRALRGAKSRGVVELASVGELGDTLSAIHASLVRLRRDGVALTYVGLRQLGLRGRHAEVLLLLVEDLALSLRGARAQKAADGQAVARAGGKFIGRPPKTTPEQREDISRRLGNGESVTAVAGLYGLSRATVAKMKPE